MFRKLILSLGLALPALAWQTAVAEPLPPAAQWLAPDAVIVLEVSSPKALLDRALNPRLTEAITSLPDYQRQALQPAFQRFQAGVQYFEGLLSTSWQTGLGKLTAGGITLAVNPDRSGLVIVDSEDGAMLGKLHEVLQAVGKRNVAQQKQSGGDAADKYRGASIWSLGNKAWYTILGNRLLVASQVDALKVALDRRDNPSRDSLASLPAYQAAKQAAGPDAAARLFVNGAVLKHYPPMGRALEHASDPMGALLSASLSDALRQANWLALGLHVDGSTLALDAAVDGRASSGAATFASPSPAEGALPNLDVPRRIAALSFYRDLHGFYAAKDKLFPERTSGLILFENMMGIFFSGRDLTEEVLAQAKPEIRFVVAQQQYDPAIGTPQVQLPAAAVVFRVRRPGEFGEVAEEAWQKWLGLTNFTRGQKALPGLIIDRKSHGDTQFTVAYYSATAEKSKTDIDIRFNYRPSLVRLGEYLILSSTDGLAADLIDALKKEMAGPVKPLPQTNTLLEIDGPAALAALAVNRQNLVRQNMIDKGNTPERAEEEIAVLLTAMKYLGQVDLSLGQREDQTHASFKVKLNLP